MSKVSVFSTALQVLFRALLVQYTCYPKSRPAGAGQYRYTSPIPAVAGPCRDPHRPDTRARLLSLLPRPRPSTPALLPPQPFPHTTVRPFTPPCVWSPTLRSSCRDGNQCCFFLLSALPRINLLSRFLSFSSLVVATFYM